MAYYYRSRSQQAAMWETYTRKVLSYDPIAYWTLAESSGTEAHCLVNSAQNGTATGVTWGQSGIGDRLTCPQFDGTNDYVNVYSTTLRDAFNGAEGTIALWLRVSGVGVWTDSTARYFFRIYAGTNDEIYLSRVTTDNALIGIYRAGGTNKALYPTSSSVDWLHFAITWSASADEVRVYLSGSQFGSIQTGLGTWGGTITSIMIGAGTAVPAAVWDGYIAHAALWTTPLSAAQISDLASV